MKMTPSEIRAGMRRAAEQLGPDTPEGRVVRAIVEKLEARFQHAGGKWFEGQPPGITDVQVDKIGYYLLRRELKLIRAKHDTGKYLEPVIAARRAARDADRDLIRAHREAGGSLRVKALQRGAAGQLNSTGRGYLESILKEIKT